jgi:hypothetical protein
MTSHSSLKYSPYSSAIASNALFACVPSYQPKSLLFKPRWIRHKIPAVTRDRIVWLASDEPELSLRQAISHVVTLAPALCPLPKTSVRSSASTATHTSEASSRRWYRSAAAMLAAVDAIDRICGRKLTRGLVPDLGYETGAVHQPCDERGFKRLVDPTIDVAISLLEPRPALAQTHCRGMHPR